MVRRSVVTSIFAALLLVAWQQGRGQSNLVRQLAPGVYTRAAEPDKRIIANTSWIAFRDYVVVIDANYPWGARAILEDVRRTGNKPIRFVFDTHYHADHAFGNSVWVDAGATLICTEDCVAESKAKNTRAWNSNTATDEYSLKPYRLEHPQIAFRDRLVLDDGTRRLELLRVGPAHTRGDAVAYLPAERILFTGDVCTNSTSHNLADPDADLDNWVRALDKLATWDVATVVPGHGALGTADTLRGDSAYLADLLKQVRAGIARGQTVDQIADAADLSSHPPWGAEPARVKAAVKAVYAQLQKK